MKRTNNGNESDSVEDEVMEEEKPKRKLFLILSCMVCLLVVIAAISCYGLFHHYFGLLGKDNSEQPEYNAPDNSSQMEVPFEEQESSSPIIDSLDLNIDEIEEQLMENLEEMEQNSGLYATDAFNILLIGVDARSNTMTGRSDSMILVSINKNTKRVLMTSFLRDIYLSIPNHESNRLNAAYAFGGTSLLKDTIRANFGITVDRCITINFYLLIDLVDAIGGIDLSLDSAEIEYMNNYISSQNKLLGKSADADKLEVASGTVHVNGNQALAYARLRYIGTDFGRTGRQRIIIQKCLEKIKKMGIKEINALAEEYLPRIQTDLSESDCASLLLMALNLSSYQIDSMAIPIDNTWRNASIRKMSVLLIDFKENSDAWLSKINAE